MPAPSPIALKDTSAAKLLQLPVADFRRLVKSNVLPPPIRIGEFERWLAKDIEAIVSGQTEDGISW